MAESKHVTYEDAGVDTAEGGRAVDAIRGEELRCRDGDVRSA